MSTVGEFFAVGPTDFQVPLPVVTVPFCSRNCVLQLDVSIQSVFCCDVLHVLPYLLTAGVEL